MRICRLAIAAGLLFALPPVSAEPGLLPPLIPPRAAPALEPEPECWKPHVQIQASPGREVLPGEKSFGERYRQMAEEHAGAEHPTKARLRPCSSVPPDSSGGQGEAPNRR